MITDEMANEALGATEFARNKATREWMRAALTAALPLIRGAVVEECARVAADHGLITCDNDHDEGRVDASNDIAAAIRALKGGEA